MKIAGGKKRTALWIGGPPELDEAYFPKVMATIAAQGVLRPGVTLVHVKHDDDCPKLSGGPCRCEADVPLEPYTPAKEGAS